MQEKNISWLKLIRRSLKLPILFLIIGFALVSLSWLVPPQVSSTWRHAVSTADTLGHILTSLSFILFIYLIIANAVRVYETHFRNRSQFIPAGILAICRNGLKVVFGLFALNTIIATLALQEQYFDITHNIILVVIIAAIAWTLLQILFLSENILRNKYAALPASEDAKQIVTLYTKIHVFKNIGVIIIVVLAVAASLMVFDKVRDIGISLLASAGFLTAVLALAAQKTLGSLFVGFQFFLSQPVQIGDAVVVENEFGNIEEISLSSVVVKLWDLRRLILPASYFLEKPFQNWSRGGEGLVGSIMLYVDYTFPVGPLRNELNTIIQTIPYWNHTVCELVVFDCKETTMQLRVLVSALDPGRLDKLRFAVREKLLDFIQKNYPDSLPRLRVNCQGALRAP
jgi:hypothetical protein